MLWDLEEGETYACRTIARYPKLWSEMRINIHRNSFLICIESELG
jgi:hypothetical protein